MYFTLNHKLKRVNLNITMSKMTESKKVVSDFAKPSNHSKEVELFLKMKKETRLGQEGQRKRGYFCHEDNSLTNVLKSQTADGFLKVF